MVKGIKLAALFIFLLFCSCSQNRFIADEQPVWKDIDTVGISEPPYEEPSLLWLSVKRSIFDQGLELADLDRDIRKLFGKPAEAKNINSIDEVPNSTWFTNRHGYPSTSLSTDEIELGVNITPGPDTSDNWYVYRPKQGGATAGFWIEDSRGDQYIIKFDPVNNPEMATAAAAMGSRYFHACGYNTPQETIVYWHPDILKIREGATYKDENGHKNPLTLEYIMKMLENVHHESDGRIRSLASLNLGNVKGPFMYQGTRDDDINDWCPHEHRRELRGLYVIGSLINHYDLKDHNSMDVFVGEDGSGYLRHYLMDFGSCFGSDGQAVKIPRKGYANVIDIRDILVSIITLGMKSWAWEYAQPAQYPSIGYFESELFEPDKFDPIYPNPAFEQLTARDAYWGAKIVMSFADNDLKALIKTGQLSNPKAEDYLLHTLIKRRDKIGRHWFNKLSPLDYFSVDKTDNGILVSFDDLAIKYELERSAVYRLEYSCGAEKYEKEFTEPSFAIDTGNLMKAKNTDFNTKSDINLDISIKVKRENGRWLSPVKLVIKYNYITGESRLLSIVH